MPRPDHEPEQGYFVAYRNGNGSFFFPYQRTQTFSFRIVTQVTTQDYFVFTERATFLDILVPATILTLLAEHPRLRNHYDGRLPAAAEEEQRPATPAQDRLNDSSGSSSEDDAADDEDYVQHSGSDSSSSSSSSASPAGSSSDDEPVEPQDNLIRQSPYGPTFCDFFMTD